MQTLDLFGQAPAPAVKNRAMGSHHSARPGTVTWLTPPSVIEALGGAEAFDLDPCAPAERPWPTARLHVSLPQDGLSVPWAGRVWLNPPYSDDQIGKWLRKMADHDQGTALIFARTETEAFHAHVWPRASGLLFLKGRLHFHHADGRRAAHNAGAPSVLIAYGMDDLDRLFSSELEGARVALRLPRFFVVAALDQTWRDLIVDQMRQVRGPVAVADLYARVAAHPKARANPNWRAKVRQTLGRGPFQRQGRGEWRLDEAYAA